MPTYEYLCQSCGERLEVFQKFSAKPLKVHDECGGALQKVFHASGVVFKGSGYYVTDSRGSASTGRDKNGSEPKTDAKSDSKTDAKAEKSASKESKPAKSSKSDKSDASTSAAAAS